MAMRRPVPAKQRQNDAGFRFGSLLSLLLVLLLAAGCIRITPSEDTPVPTPQDTATPTPTIVWFPPTPTPTPAPTRETQPTPFSGPVHGEVLFSEAFKDPAAWSLDQMQPDVSGIAKGYLTLAITSEKASLFSFYQGKYSLPNDYFLQVSLEPSLCKGEDQYGVLFRSPGKQSFYRLLITCSGNIALQRVSGGQVAYLQNWTRSGQILSGGLLKITVGIEARGKNLQIFINDQHQFTVQDSMFSEGSIGVYAKSAGDTPLTVKYSDLSVYALELKSFPTPAAPSTP